MAQQSKQEKKGTAGVKLVNTTELLEQVLLNLPLRRLLTSQRVNRVWRDTIASSHALKKKMWLLPRAPAIDDLYPEERLLAPVHDTAALTLSPLVRLSLPGDGATSFLRHFEAAFGLVRAAAKRLRKNPRKRGAARRQSKRVCTEIGDGGVSLVGNAPITASIMGTAMYPHRLSRTSFRVCLHFIATNPKNSTWLDTILTDAPIKAIKLIYNGSQARDGYTGTVRRDEPLTLRAIYEAYEDFVGLLKDVGIIAKPEDIEGRFMVKRTTEITGTQHCVCSLNDDENEECGCFEFLKEKET
ncbi:hypothetical protein PRZ48_009053 [Zasmidium cellare]|uniref:F-box domain-containing protein n=1 Tax=Zasmidium cellare TaxID=395010 RepID=A0ABR0EHZ5_ZASCE|nr:hypothetical protein PRZ48_009053 [Zasmidium cellare]